MKEQRVIKFRVIHDNTIIGYDRLTDKGWQWMCPDLNPDNGSERWVHGVIQDSDNYKYIRDQFTGLLDKAGNEIYEGDIVRTATDKPMVVGWSNHFASFVIHREGWAFQHWFGEACDPKDCEVLGNVHQHKHLIE